MAEQEFPQAWLRLLRAARNGPNGILSLDEDHDEQTEALAERLTDLGYVRIVTAKRYLLTEAGLNALARHAASPARALSQPGHWLRRLIGRR